MLKKIRRALKWTKTAKYYHHNEFSEFLIHLGEYENLYQLDSYERALKGAALLMTEDYAASEKEFSCLARGRERSGSAKDRYISLYASAMLDSIHGRDEEYKKKKVDADRINCGILYKKMLPL